MKNETLACRYGYTKTNAILYPLDNNMIKSSRLKQLFISNVVLGISLNTVFNLEM
jgi:hypothetical protein